MKLIIKQIVIYPKGRNNAPRAMEFEANAINVITGTSARGKSAVLHIIDYCLGSHKCAVPVGIIRDAVSWYGLLLEVSTGYIFVARREPGEAQQSEDYCVVRMSDPALPIRPEKNTNRGAFKALMDDMSGLPDLPVSFGDVDAGSQSRASFRDMAAFNFLPQHIVANPHTLFFKTDDLKHREKLRAIFPLVLGVVDSRYLAAVHQEKELRRALQKLETEHEQRRHAADAFRAELAGMFMRARELGLLSQEASMPSTQSLVLAMLRGIIGDSDAIDHAVPPVGATERSVKELTTLDRSESQLARDLARLRRELRRVDSLSGGIQSHAEALVEESLRVVVGPGWFSERMVGAQCGFCGAQNDRAREQSAAVRNALKELGERVEAAHAAPLHLERQALKIRVEIRAAEEQLQAIRREKHEIEELSRESARYLQQSRELHRFVGRLEQSLMNMEVVDDSGDLLQAIGDLRLRLEKLRDILDSGGVRRRMKVALARISRYIRDVARTLELERREDEIEFVPKDLALVFLGRSGRRDYLWEVGSGENWMGYHISLFMALHRYFAELEVNPVPSFLVIDQPTQVYFPARRDTYEQAKEAAGEGALSGGDFEKARAIFESLSVAVEQIRCDFQVIVTEHADDVTWGNVARVLPVENLRGDRFLIPPSWSVDEMPVGPQ